jgi:exodeoxyribonuclease V alpha subunit
MTLHRLLGWSPSRLGFRHRRDNPLAERLVIVDESSMIDVFLMERLASALLPDARLVLLGDAEQLPSVAAGAVFRDLGRAGRVPAVALTKSHRMDPSRPEGFNILSVAGRVNEGALPSLVRPSEKELLPSRLDAIGRLTELPPDLDALSGVFLYEPESPLDRERFLDRWSAARRPSELSTRTWQVEGGRVLDEAALEPLFAEAERARLLCVTKSAARPTGVVAVNASLHRRFADERGRGAQPALLLAGEPVLVQRNDYERGLFNGDQGLVLFTAAAAEGPRPSAVFRGREGFVAHPLEAVRASIELGYATTVHKAQGGEHDRVALLLPETDSPRLLTREIVYTAITRARRSVLLVGSPELLARAAARRVERSTGIAARMAARL